MFNTECPSCGEKIHLKTKPKIGQRILCSSCAAGLRVISENPLAVALAVEEWVEPAKLQRNQLHPSRVKHQKSVLDEFEDEELDGDPGLNPGRPGKKRSKNKKRRYASHQYNFDDEDF